MACERRKAFTKGAVQALNKPGVEFLTSLGHHKERLRFLSRSSGKLTCHVDYPLLLGMLDDRGNAQIRPDLQKQIVEPLHQLPFLPTIFQQELAVLPGKPHFVLEPYSRIDYRMFVLFVNKQKKA